MENIQFVKVNSSNVQEVGYSDNNLYVKYKSGTYKYENVDKSVYESLLTSESKGKFMNENIKGKYNYSRV
jgi:hypothetical protein